MESLKRFLAVGLLMFGLSAFAANPAYESFKGTNGQVVTTPGIGAARIVMISGELFQPGSTNLTNWANLPTNVVSGANIWTQSGGTAFPTSADAIVATNVQSWDKLIAKGAFIAETRSRTLVAGTNTLAVLTNSYLLLDSPTNDAASVVVQIGAAASLGQLLFVVNNQTNRAFTIYDGSPSGSGIVELQGNFVSTNLGGLILMNQGNWVEVGRFSPAGLTTSATINPTDNFLPYRLNATTFGDSPLLKNTNQPGVQLNGGLWFHGTGTTNAAITNGPSSETLYIVNGNGTSYGNLFVGELNAIDMFIPHLNENAFTAPGTNRIAAGITLLQPVTGVRGVTNSMILDGVPTLPDGQSAGQIKWLLGRSTNSVTVQDESVLPGSNLLLKSGTRTLGFGDVLTLMWDTAIGSWSEVSFSATNASPSGPTFADLVWTNNGGFIIPNGIGANTNAIEIRENGSLLIGFGADPFQSGSGIFLVQTNDNAPFQVEVTAVNPPWTRQALVELKSQTITAGDTAFAELAHEVFDTTGQFLNASYTVRLDAGVPNVELSAFSDSFGTTLFNWKPTIPDGASAVAYTFNTFTNLSTAGSLLASFQNKGLSHFTINPTNGVATPAITAYGAGSAPWQFGMATNTVDVLLGATNAVEIVVGGVAYLLPAKLK